MQVGLGLKSIKCGRKCASASGRIRMRRMLNCVFILLILTITSSCSHKLVKPEWVHEEAAVRMHFKADSKLNLYNNKAHTLYLCFYQLQELNAFDQLTLDPAGIRRLLECRLFDDSVVSASSKVIHAGEDITLTLDRAERARYLSLVAGYSSELTGERVVRRYKFQVHKTKEGYFKQIHRCVPCDLSVDVSLGANQIEYSKIIPHEGLGCSDECE